MVVDLNHGKTRITASDRMRTNPLDTCRTLGVACSADMMFYMEGKFDNCAL